MTKQFCRFLSMGIVAAGMIFAGVAAHALQDNSAGQPAAQSPEAGGGGGGRRGMMTPEQTLARMTTRYNLTPDQQNQIKPILESQQQQMQTLRQDSSLSREDRMTKMAGIRTDSGTKIRAVLNDQQKQMYDQDQQQMQQRMQQRENGGGGGGGMGPGGQ